MTIRERRLYPEPVAEIVTDLLVEHFGEYVDLQFTARMEEELDEVARGERAWVPLLRAFYGPLKTRRGREAPRAHAARPHDRGDRRGLLGRAPHGDPAGTERPVPGLLALPGAQGEPAASRRGARGAATSRAPARPARRAGRPRVGSWSRSAAGSGRSSAATGTRPATYIKRDGPPPPDQLPFEITCPTCGEGHLVARRARRTGSVFWGCSRYPKCDFTTSREPLGPVHDVDGGPVARRDEHAALCLKCGAPVAAAGRAAAAARDPAARRRAGSGRPRPALVPRRRGEERRLLAGPARRSPAAPRPRRAAGRR